MKTGEEHVEELLPPLELELLFDELLSVASKFLAALLPIRALFAPFLPSSGVSLSETLCPPLRFAAFEGLLFTSSHDALLLRLRPLRVEESRALLAPRRRFGRQFLARRSMSKSESANLGGAQSCLVASRSVPT